MALFQALGIARKVFKGVRGTIRAKRRAKKARHKTDRARKLLAKSQATLEGAGYGMAAKVLQGTPQISSALNAVQETVLGASPNMNAESSDSTTSFTSTGPGDVEDLKWYQKIPMWAWFLIAPVGLVLLVILFKAIFKRR